MLEQAFCILVRNDLRYTIQHNVLILVHLLGNNNCGNYVFLRIF
jgi:hypothetical protein